MATHIRFNDSDDDNDYQPTDSEDELPEKDKQLLRKARSKGSKYSDSEEEVFGVYEESDVETDDQSDLALSDVEGQGEEDDDGIPNAKAWGKQKNHYYATDYVDQDYGGFTGNDATLAEMEEAEAKNLQYELAKNMHDDDFMLDFLPEDTPQDKQEKSDVIKADISQLSKREKLQMLKKESPEFFGLVEDYPKKITLCKDELYPVIQLYKEGKIKNSEAMEFMTLYYQHILAYTTNIIMYLRLKLTNTSIKNHPIIRRLYQYRQLLAQMDPIYEEQIKPQLECLIEKATEILPEKKKDKTKNKKLLNILKQTSKETEPEASSSKRKRSAPLKSILKTKEAPEMEEIALGDSPHVKFAADSDDSEEERPEEIGIDESAELDDEETGEHKKRAITYQIAKNKGLMPHRKKDQRNPRVKHRNKFRKAIIRRKGAVREVRREISRYGGEISGIKASVSKSIKLKS